MAMKAYANPDAYMADLSGGQKAMATRLRETVLAVGGLEEHIKWGHLVYFHNGPCLLIRVEGDCVMFGFWRGQRLREFEPRLRPGGKYEMARIDLTAGDDVSSDTVRALVREAIRLNTELGDPTKL